MTNEEMKRILSERGIPVPARAKKADLERLIAESSISEDADDGSSANIADDHCLIAYIVKVPFRDKYTGEVYKAGQLINVTRERAKEILGVSERFIKEVRVDG